MARVYLLPIPVGLVLGVGLAWVLGWFTPRVPESAVLAVESAPGVGARPEPSVIRPRYFEQGTSLASDREAPRRVWRRFGRLAVESAPEPARAGDPWYISPEPERRSGAFTEPARVSGATGAGTGPPETESEGVTYEPFGPSAPGDPWYVYDRLHHGPIPRWGAAAQARYSPRRDAPVPPITVGVEAGTEVAPWYVFPPGNRFLDRPESDRDGAREPSRQTGTALRPKR